MSGSFLFISSLEMFLFVCLFVGGGGRLDSFVTPVINLRTELHSVKYCPGLETNPCRDRDQAVSNSTIETIFQGNHAGHKSRLGPVFQTLAIEMDFQPAK